MAIYERKLNALWAARRHKILITVPSPFKNIAVGSGDDDWPVTYFGIMWLASYSDEHNVIGRLFIQPLGNLPVISSHIVWLAS